MIKKITCLLVYFVLFSCLSAECGMTFFFGQWQFSFVEGSNNQTYMFIVADEENVSKEDVFFKPIDFSSKRIFSYGPLGKEDAQKQCVAWWHAQLKQRDVSAKSLQAIKRRKRSEEPCELIINNSLLEKLKDKNIIVYTGAGISAPVVPTMNMLCEQANFSNLYSDSVVHSFIKSTIKEPETLWKVFKNFFYACKNGKPTEAHKAVARLVKGQKNWLLMTENVDLLHNKTNVSFFGRGNGNQKIPDLKKADVVLTIGLGTDDRGYLYQFKHKNPQGLILAFNKEKPYYLGKEDYLIKGDVQKTVPAFAELVLKNKK